MWKRLQTNLDIRILAFLSSRSSADSSPPQRVSSFFHFIVSSIMQISLSTIGPFQSNRMSEGVWSEGGNAMIELNEQTARKADEERGGCEWRDVGVDVQTASVE
ncbi:hypothetical protein BLNAU_20114 [Blattamonas nauphoetae]|uniref:Uncharacterized protein n=1 Tax=Blattamonas nauphoetae TaxID=2049346 RepID=A0ABQ9X049_9EUKA|nr:hypothetical protein BLNAU_20114 [Blattamonas nauphoetae]